MGLSEHPRKKFENVPISSFLILTLCFADGLPQLQNHVKFNHKQQVSWASHFHLSTCLSFLEKGGHQCSQMTQNLHPSWEIGVMMNPMHLVEALACCPMREHPCIHSNIPSDSKISPTGYRETVKIVYIRENTQGITMTAYYQDRFNTESILLMHQS